MVAIVLIILLVTSELQLHSLVSFRGQVGQLLAADAGQIEHVQVADAVLDDAMDTGKRRIIR